MDQINYKEFLKYSYLCHLFFNHLKLEEAMREADQENGDQITVAQLDVILAETNFNLPPNALDQVFQEMLGCDLENVDRSCIIKIEPFMQNLRQQFDDIEGDGIPEEKEMKD